MRFHSEGGFAAPRLEALQRAHVVQEFAAVAVPSAVCLGEQEPRHGKVGIEQEGPIGVIRIYRNQSAVMVGVGLDCIIGCRRCVAHFHHVGDSVRRAGVGKGHEPCH